jgi:hypothetical protein
LLCWAAEIAISPRPVFDGITAIVHDALARWQCCVSGRKARRSENSMAAVVGAMA